MAVERADEAGVELAHVSIVQYSTDETGDCSLYITVGMVDIYILCDIHYL